MDAVTPELSSLAQRLLAHESSGVPPQGGGLHAALRVCGKLRSPLVTFVGIEGHRALLARALILARAQEPLLAALRVNPDGSLDALEEAEALFDGNEGVAAGSLLISELITLLQSFIGLLLTLRLMARLWPDFVHEEIETLENP